MEAIENVQVERELRGFKRRKVVIGSQNWLWTSKTGRRGDRALEFKFRKIDILKERITRRKIC